MPLDYKQIRIDLGLSLSEMATMLGLSGSNASHMVWEIEVGRREPTGPIKKLYEIYSGMPNAI